MVQQGTLYHVWVCAAVASYQHCFLCRQLTGAIGSEAKDSQKCSMSLPSEFTACATPCVTELTGQQCCDVEPVQNQVCQL